MANAPPLWSSKPKVHDRNLLYFSPFYLSANRRYSTSFSSKHPYACCRQRWQHEGGNGSSRAHKSRTWNQYISMLDDSIALAPLFEQRGRISCFQSHCRCGQYLKTTVPTVLFDTSSLPLEKHSLGSNSVNPDHVPYANVGLNEPHVAGTKWSDTILEKKGLGSCHPQTEPTDLEGFLTSRLPSHSNLYRGQLKNGLHYLILPNKIPANGFEAYMEVRVGSIDEEDDEQGIAHMIEHVAFLGSKKRERLLETGAQSNAYTDFHHTVFHIHSPTSTKDSDGDLLPFVLDALNEIAFQPKFLTCRVEKERQAILSELQMMNSIEYRVHCQLLQHLHSENKLSKRFPIGLEQQIKKWNVAEIRRFHERWYFPANATLYVVGDINNLTKTVYRIETIFSQTFAGVETAPLHTQRPFGAMVGFLVPKLSVELAGKFSNDGPSISKDQSGSVRRLAVRPLVEHQWSLAGTGQNAKPPQIFQHELLQNFSFHVFRKIPVKKVQTYGDLRNVLMERIFLSALHFRINTISKSPKPPFTSIEFDHSDSGREGCTVSTLTVTAEPQNWCNAIKVAVQEVRRLKEFGITKGELARYMDPLLKDGEQSATKIDNVQSVDLDFIMENEALGHTIMDQSQGAQSLVAVAETVTLAEINSTGAEMLEFISDFGKPTAPLPAAIVACAPKKVYVDGMVETEFNIYPHEITEALKAGLEEPIQAEPELEVPKELISSSQLQELRLLCKPSFIPLGQGLNTLKLHDKETGIMQRRLSNGIPVNYKVTKNETSSGVMRLVVGGGRATESSEAKGAVVVGLRTLREGGWVGKFSREQVELFCVNHLINCSLESTEEFICIEFQFTLGDDGMHAAFQLLHMVLEHSAWLEDAFDKAVQIYLSNYSSIHKRLERLTAHKLMLAMLNGDERFVEPTPKSLKKLTLQSVKEAVMNQFVADNMEVNIVGDFKEDDIESCILDYIGTVKIPRSLRGGLVFNPITFRPSPSELQFQQVYLKDTDDRAHAYIAGPAPSRWGFTVEGQDLFEFINNRSRRDEQSNSEESLVLGRKNVSKIRGHPFFFGITLRLLADIINSRLFATVRDSLGLTYDVSFELSLFDRLNLGWYIISVNSTRGKVCKAVNACKKVLRGLHDNKIAQRELDQSKRALLMRHEAETKSNTYWLRLLTHLQASSVPRKEISGIRGLDLLYEAATIEDIYLAYENLKVDEGSLFSCIGIAGAHAGEDFPDEGSDVD